MPPRSWSWATRRTQPPTWARCPRPPTTPRSVATSAPSRRGRHDRRRHPFDIENEVVGLVLPSPFGFNAMISSENLPRAHRVAARLQVGAVWVNCFLIRDLRAPFGGGTPVWARGRLVQPRVRHRAQGRGHAHRRRRRPTPTAGRPARRRRARPR
ncbi:aldehyde dehydrogenase family protein [Georgenia yuyongxinii]